MHNLFLRTFSVSKQPINSGKLWKTHIQNVTESYQLLPLHILSKEISKAVSNSKNESIE
jgi:hypothetical protein